MSPTPESAHPDIRRALARLEGRPLRHVFFVACGGSLSVMYPAKYLLDRHSAALTSECSNAAEFTARDPRSLDERSLVILCSMTGTTRETVEAARHARARGAATIGLSLDPASPLAEAVDVLVRFEAPYTTGVPIDAADSNYARLYALVIGLVAQRDGIDHRAALATSLAHWQRAIDKAQALWAPLFEAYAPRFATRDVIYTLGSGANFGAAYSFAICVLMEMQWIDSQAIHSNEFFHGPFEVVDRQSSFILMLGLGPTRALDLRAKAFLDRFAAPEEVLVLDAETLDLDGIDPLFRENVVPLILFDTLWRFAYALADRRRHPMLTGRRYMKKIAY